MGRNERIVAQMSVFTLVLKVELMDCKRKVVSLGTTVVIKWLFHAVAGTLEI